MTVLVHSTRADLESPAHHVRIARSPGEKHLSLGRVGAGQGEIAAALKRATLERKLANVTPNAVQEILEEALEPWLTTNGYLN